MVTSTNKQGEHMNNYTQFENNMNLYKSRNESDIFECAMCLIHLGTFVMASFITVHILTNL